MNTSSPKKVVYPKRSLRMVYLQGLFLALCYPRSSPTTSIVSSFHLPEQPTSHHGITSSRLISSSRLLSTKLHLAAESTKKVRKNSMTAAISELGTVPYGESSRRYRRTIYDHDDWLKHRANDRLLGNLFSMFYSGVIRQVKNKILFVTAVSISVILWNDYLPTWINMNYSEAPLHLPHLCLPTLPFTLSSPALGLLLVFRTNTSYQRWSEGRARWGTIVSHSKNVVRMSSSFADMTNSNDKLLIYVLSNAIWLVSRTLMYDLLGPREDREQYSKELQNIYDKNDDLVNRLLSISPQNNKSRMNIALVEASISLDSIPIDEKRRVEIDKSLVIIGDSISSCERIFSSPVPLVYTRHTARFLSMWMILLPFAIHDEFVRAQVSGIPTLPATAILSLFLFGIEELAVQLEEPFSILPMQVFCDEILESNREIIEYSQILHQRRKEKMMEKNELITHV